MFDFLYNVCIAPLVMIIEACYVALNEILESEGWAVVGISVIVTILTLPLYDVAERWQQLERDTQARLKGGVDRIKAVFKGDEQYDSVHLLSSESLSSYDGTSFQFWFIDTSTFLYSCL